MINHNWYVVRSRCGKYDDGYFGWDSSVHDDKQIYRDGELPYTSGYDFVLVARGPYKPSIETVLDALRKNNSPSPETI